MGFNFSLCALSLLLSLLCSMCSAVEYRDLVYKGCADQNFQDPSGSYAKTLRTLFDSLISQSAKTNFSKTTATGDGSKDAIFGLYQCRGDLSGIDCYNCVSLFPKLARKLCGDALAARVQLVGCYMRYEIVGFRQVEEAGFDEKRESAFEEVESGVASGNGFYAASYGSVYVMGQCEGDLVGADCGDCVRTALERAKAECGEAISGQVYLNRCYVSYSYYPNGVGDSDEKATSSPGTKHNTAKTVAIVVGATAAAGFGVVLVLFTKSVLKKKTSTPKYYYEYGR
ncbi:hypothetical protein Cgig2_020817 [Carnegiea gigantea]|uniref:Gnk2-homologous domain-containing protein n=1 Tax=Carnegiea gigantea TaxID=171969 RepID=A0A9Q1QJM4_9CARY|nr:hypothetical protein Cgig2_020817 [Carnegiea gigantea]